MKKKTIIVLIAVVLLSAIGFLIYHKDHRKTKILTSSSEDERYQVVVYQIGDAEFPFGPGNCEIALYKENKKIDSEDVVLYNDGKNPDEDNFIVHWDTDSVEIIVKAEEADDQTVIFELNAQ